MTAQLKNIVLVGATGNIGSPVLEQLRAAEPKFNITVLSRASSTATFPSDVHVVKVDYDNLASLTQALHGQDAIVSTIGAAALDNAQKNLVAAAAAAGIKLFVPSEFGVDTLHPASVEVKVFGAKVQLVQELEKAKVPYAVIATGPFLDWGLANGFLGIDIKNKSASLINDGNARVSGTSLASVGKAVVAVLQHADKAVNQRIAVSDTTFTQNELLAEVQRQVGGDAGAWTVSHTPLEQVKQEGFAKLSDPSHIGVLYLIKAAIFSGTEASYWVAGKDHSAEFGLKQRTLKDIVAQVVSQ
ncbi:hypothetical protein BCR44DRAFT_1404898, partial [Catenaria anguillulae PL171]